MKWFRKPTLIEQLQLQLEETKTARINATAKVALWKAEEKFKLSEQSRLEAEIEHLTAEASAADGAVVLEVGAVAEGTAAEARPLRRIH